MLIYAMTRISLSLSRSRLYSIIVCLPSASTLTFVTILYCTTTAVSYTTTIIITITTIVAFLSIS